MANKIKFFDLTRQYKRIRKEIDAAIKRVLESGIFIEGKEVEDFEKKIAKFCDTKYAIGLNSGTDALFLSLKALGIGQGDEVITPSLTFIATAETITNCGAKPVFIDINPITCNIDPKRIKEKITKKTKAIVPVHFMGQMVDMYEIKKIARQHKLYVIEDAAEAIGAEYKGEKAGSIGDLGCFSFFPTKNLGAYGDGGMITTNSKELTDKIRILKNHGSSPKDKYFNLVPGINSRLDALQAAILGIRLKYLTKRTKQRQEIARYYNGKLRRVGDITVPETFPDRTHIFYQYNIRTKYRDDLQKYLKQNGILTLIHFPLPLHLQPAFKYLGYKKGDLPESEKAVKETLSLPIYPEFSRKEQDFVIKKIIEFYD